ncbi:hypothetical protein BLNAU_8194 [Blattamonas nauphoetae]|uniref:DEAD-box helicase OB fold domain-containing protein n=1 Tax=Blattamonas nauphoetae TaxID=2049346 RepID=A0ABQ9XZJ3_9EUKA|nr:hypothetical protein BLNAU_8194 [Blattamonas nauphoetae]
MLNVFNAAQKHDFQKKWQEQRSIDSQKMEQVCAIRANLFALLKRIKLFRRQSEPASVETVQRCICSAFFQNMATRPPTHSGLIAQFVLLSQQPVEVHPSSFVFAYPPPMFVFVELLTNAQGRHYAHLVTQITEEWLLEVGSKYYEKKSVTETIADEEQKLKERKERDRKKHEIEANYQEERKWRAESGKFDAFSLFGDSEQIRDLF